MRQVLAGDVIDALVPLWQSTISSSAYAQRARVFDGPPVTDRTAEIEVWVGSTGDSAADDEVISGVQDWASMGDGHDRDEALDVTCALWVASTTGTDMGPTRRTTLDVLTLLAGAVRGTNLGLDDVQDTVAVTSYRLRQGQFSSGAMCVATFTIHVEGWL